MRGLSSLLIWIIAAPPLVGVVVGFNSNQPQVLSRNTLSWHKEQGSVGVEQFVYESSLIVPRPRLKLIVDASNQHRDDKPGARVIGRVGHTLWINGFPHTFVNGARLLRQDDRSTALAFRHRIAIPLLLRGQTLGRPIVCIGCYVQFRENLDVQCRGVPNIVNMHFVVKKGLVFSTIVKDATDILKTESHNADLPTGPNICDLDPRPRGEFQLALRELGSSVRLFQLPLKDPCRPQRRAGYHQGQNNGGYFSPFRLISWSFPVAAQPIADSSQNLGWRWYAIFCVGAILWVAGGVIVWRGVHIMDEILGVGVPCVIFGLVVMTVGLWMLHWTFLKANPFLNAGDSVTRSRCLVSSAHSNTRIHARKLGLAAGAADRSGGATSFRAMTEGIKQGYDNGRSLHVREAAWSGELATANGQDFSECMHGNSNSTGSG